MRRLAAGLVLCALPWCAVNAQDVPAPAPAGTDVDAAVLAAAIARSDDTTTPAIAVAPTTVAAVPTTRSGREIYQRFREGLADPDCSGERSSARWRKHYAAAPRRMADESDDVLALFGYVVDALREASLPTEYALIPFIESGYKPGARSRLGPAGMWQMIRLTARAHHVPMHSGYDGRLSPVASTRAAVRYLKTLHGMFAGDWRLAAMAYNAGEYRVLGALRSSRQVARSADPEKLTSLSGITRAYVRKLNALSCLFDHAGDGEQWLQSLDRQVPVLEARDLAPGTRDLRAWAREHGRDPDRVRRLNPAFARGSVTASSRKQQVLVPAYAPALLATETAAGAGVEPGAITEPGASGPDAAAQAH